MTIEERGAVEDDLVLACQRSEEGAAESLVDLLWDRVFAFVYRLTMNATDAEDLTQETFLRALRSIQTYKPDGRFKSWIFRIATNLYLDQKKAVRNRDVTSADLSHHADVGGDPEEAQTRAEMLEALYAAMQDLTKEQRLVVMLRGMEHMDYPAIAHILNVQESTARWHMYEARRILRQKLSRRFDLEGLADE